MKNFPGLLLALAGLALAVPAPAQQVVYSAGFESGLTGWTANGLWNSEDASDPCGSQAAPFAEGSKAAWYGSSALCSYETGGSNTGTLTNNDWIAIPNAPSISLHFWMWSHSEYCWADSYGTTYDYMAVFVLTQGGAQVQFPQCASTGVPAATLLSSGSVSVTNDTLSLRVEHMPPNASAILTQSTGTSAGVVFGDGVRCISGSLLRMGSTAAQNGVATWPVGPDSISVRGMIPAAGATRYYYVYYRDVVPYCSSATYNLTDTQRIVWVP